MSDKNNINDLLFVEQRRNREQQKEEQQKEEHQTLQVKNFLQQDQNQQVYQNQQMNRNTVINGVGRVNLSNLEQRQVKIQSGSQNPGQPEPMPKYIGFDKAYIKAEKNDNKLMKELRINLGAYFKAKETYESRPGDTDVTGVRTYLEKCISTLQGLQDLCEQYRQTSLPLIFGKDVAIKKKQEVEQLSSRIFDEIAKVGQDYVTVLEEEFKINAKYDSNLRKRTQRPDGSRRTNNKIEVLEDGRLNLDEWNKEVHFSDYEQESVKSYLRMRCRLEGNKIVSNIDYYTNEEMFLFNLINEYAQIEDIGRKVSGTYGTKAYEGNKKTQQREYQLYSDIMKRLNVIKDSTMPDEKKKVFLSFLKMMERDTRGTLTLPADAKIADFTKLDKYKTTNIKQKANGEEIIKVLPQKMVEHKGDPLFAHVPCVSDIAQDKIGNCYLLASIANVVAEDPKAITDMFMEDGDNVVVRLYHHEMQPDPNIPENFVATNMEPVYIKINKTVEEKISKGAFWVSLLCKAFTIYLQKYNATSFYRAVNENYDRLRKQDIMTDPDTIDYGFINNGGMQSDAIPILTGKMGEIYNGVSNNVYGVGTPRDLLLKETDLNKKKMVVPKDDPKAINEFKDQETAVFEYADVTYIYHKDSHKGMLPKKMDSAKRLQYLMYFSVAADRILELARYGKALRDTLYDPEDMEKNIMSVQEDSTLKSYIKVCYDLLVASKVKISKDEIVNRLKADAVRTFKASCKSAELMPVHDKTEEIFTGKYSEEAKRVFDNINEWKEKKLLIGVGSRSKLGKTKSETGNESMGVGVVGEHAYTVLGTMKMDYNGTKILMVRVRNPWGRYTTSYRKNSKTGKMEAFTEIREDSGEFLMELTHFVQTFASIQTTTEH